MSEENRKYPRIPLDVRVNCDFNAIAHTKDISEGGICLITDVKLDEDNFIQLDFILPEQSEEIRAYGKVMWSRKATKNLFENGVNFWEIQDTDKVKIQDFFNNSSK